MVIFTLACVFPLCMLPSMRQVGSARWRWWIAFYAVYVPPSMRQVGGRHTHSDLSAAAELWMESGERCNGALAAKPH